MTDLRARSEADHDLPAAVLFCQLKDGSNEELKFTDVLKYFKQNTNLNPTYPPRNANLLGMQMVEKLIQFF